MKILVNAHTIELIEENLVNYGEYNIQKCYFKFTDEYTGLIKDAIFTDSKDSYRISLDDDNSCGIPYEITSNNELEYVKLGVYAYDVGENEQLIKRYSPSPIHFKIENGSYKPAKDSEIPSADIIEQFEKRIDDKLDEVDDAINTIEILNIDANKVDDKTTVEITRKDGSTKKVEILDGEKGDCYFATFSIVNAHLIMNKPQQITQFNFHLDNKGHLQMEVGV